MPSSGITKITINAPGRRVDLALPGAVPLAELLPDVLRHAGERLADEGARLGGWSLRRADGSALAPAEPLTVQGVLDGEVLHLVPAHVDWPELEYDDVVEAIVDAARRHSTGWTATATRYTALGVAGLALAAGLAALVSADPQWTSVGPVATAVALALLLAGSAAARAYGAPVEGAWLAAYGLPYAFVAGARALDWSAADALLVGSVALVLASTVAFLAVGYALHVFVAGATVGLVGAAAGLATSFGGPVTGERAAALVVSFVVIGVAGLPVLAVRLGRLPTATATGDPETERQQVRAAVARTDGILSGMLAGSGLALAAATLVVARGGSTSGRLLVAVAGVAMLLRARQFVTLRHRMPVLGAGVSALAVLVADAARHEPVTTALLLAVAGIGVATAGARYATQPPSPYLGRAADVLDVVSVVAMIPLSCAVLGLYQLARGLAG